MKIVIPGPPIAKARPRFRKVGNFVSTYDTQTKLKEIIQKEFLYQMPDRSPLTGVLKAVIVFYMPIPSSLSKKKKKALVEAYNGLGQYHSKKPDIDNLVKMYFDALNGLFYRDDAEIAEVYAIKRYSENPRVEFEIISLECSS